MKKIIIISLLALTLSFCGCADNGDQIAADSGDIKAPVTENNTIADTEKTTEETEISPESETLVTTEAPGTTAFPESETEAEPVTEPITKAVIEAPDTEPLTEAPETDAPAVPEDIVYSDDPEEDDDYLDIPNRGGVSVMDMMFSVTDSEITLKIPLPSNWQFEKSENGEYIITAAKEIGKFFTGEAADLDIWKTVNTESAESGDLKILRHIEKFGSKDALRFRYRYIYSFSENGEERLITLILDYESVLSTIAEKLLSGVIPSSLNSDPKFGELAHLKDGSLLILGNSFIRTSAIGSILSETMQKNSKKCTVNAISRGYAQVGTYTADTAIMSDIKSGKYSAVFICGLYSADEIANLEVLKNACDSSDTNLIIFPAHNENRSVIDAAAKKFPELTLFDWKAEIDMFINSGADKWDFCKNDSHKHSTPLAGYVGAHMIYRAIYGEVPKADLTYSIKQTDIDPILGDYTDLGYITATDKTDVTYVG